MVNDQMAMFCPECGSERVTEETCQGVHIIRGREVRIERDRHMVCADCGEWSYPGDRVGEMQQQVAAELRKMDGLASVEELKDARLRYGFTQVQMERLLGTGDKTWVRWERGKVPPSVAVDREIRRFLVDPAYVGRLMDEKGVDNPTAREVVADALARAQDRAAEAAAANFPKVAPSDVRAISDAAIRTFGRELENVFRARSESNDIQVVLRKHVQRVPVDVESMALDLGLIVLRDPNLGKDISGKIVRLGGLGGVQRYAIHVNAHHVPVRQRYTIAHEIAHFILHRDRIGDGITEDALFRGPFSAPEERQANARAADILMPAENVRREWVLLRSHQRMAGRFKVSEDAMQIRLKELGLVAA